MTIGIYKLTFKDTDQVYIGRSKHIDKRNCQHLRSLRSGDSPYKLQKAYEVFGDPTITVLEECPLEELHLKEEHYIIEYNSIHNGFNSIGVSSATNYDIFSNKSLYPKEVYVEILFYYVHTNLSVEEISNITGASIYSINSLAALESHYWLKKDAPEDYDLLVKLQESGGRRSYINSKEDLPKVVSPDGKIFKVTNLTDFSKEHNLDRSSLWCLLNRRCSTHKNWHLEGTDIKSPGSLLSPDKEVFVIPFRGIRSFCRDHDLGQSEVTKLLKGKVKQHKGWTLA